MYKHEDLWFKISNDFHVEINEILLQLEPTAKHEYWFDRKSIPGKFFVINNVLLSLNSNEINIYNLNQIIDLLSTFKKRIEHYFKKYNLATGFLFFSPEKIVNTDKYFNSLEYRGFSYTMEISIGYIYFIGMDVIGFPNDCSRKFTARLNDNNIQIEEEHDPLFPIEKERGEKISKTKRTRTEQTEIEINLSRKNPDLYKKGEINAREKFEKFAKDTKNKLSQLYDNFDNCISLCNTLIEKKQKDTTPANLPEIEKIYFTLKNGYIQEPLEKFTAIFQPEYSGQKIIWLKSGPELKYFIDRLNDKFNLSNTINKWTDSRIEFKNISKLATYLSKQTRKDEYLLLIQGLLSKNPLYKLFRE